MNKTAMQQLIDAIDSVDLSEANADIISTAHFIKMKAIELRDTVEKAQTINDYCNGRMSVIDKSVISAYQYYTETYTNENT